MDRLELLERIASGEDSVTELKREVGKPNDFVLEMIALANSGGGDIIVGVDDDGTIVGVANKRQTEEYIVNIGRNNCTPPLDPRIEIVGIDGKDVIVAHIPPRMGRPYYNQQGQCYKRVGTTKRLASPDEHARMLEAAGLFHFEETPVARTTPDDLDKEAFAAYYEKIYGEPLSQAEIPLPRMLENLRLVVYDVAQEARLSVAGTLLFARKPQEYILYSGISAVRWAGVVAGEMIIDRQEISGRLPHVIDEAETFVLRNTRLQTTIAAVRQDDMPEYPRAAVREAIVNAVVHRDYSISGSQVRLFIFDDRIEVYSPGGLPNGLTLDNIRAGFSRTRNDSIVRMLFNLGYVNSVGSGIPRMIRLMKQHSGREPDFEVNALQCMVRLWGAPL